MDTNTMTSAKLAEQIPPGRLFIGGRWRDSSDAATKPTINPATEESITDIAQATPADVDAAVNAARATFDDGAWPTMNVHERARLMVRIADGIERRGDDLARRETLDMGKPISMSRSFDVAMLAQLFRYYGGIIPQIVGETRGGYSPVALPQPVAGLNYTVREPLGVVAAITPFNFPMLQSAAKLAPALATGNTIVHKPADGTPLSAIALAEVFDEAGLPAGAYNLLTGPGAAVGDALVRHPLVDKVSFTGSTGVGKGILKNSADTLKHTTMELGGKSANIVFADAEMEGALQNAFFGIFYNKGEICTAGSRLLVERSVHDEVVARLVAMAEGMVKGDPMDPKTVFGPLGSRAQFDKVTKYVQIGLEQGATLATGGKPFQPDGGNGRGFWYEPTILTGVKPGDRVFQEEIFGPVLAVVSFDTEEEAICLANGTEFGLASGVQTSDLKRAHRVARAMKAGTVWVNTYNMYDATTPFGGYKTSGFGRECGPEALDGYTQTKSVWISLA